VPKTSIDTLLESIETVQVLKDAVTQHEAAIETILKYLERIEQRLAMVEARDLP